jgi:hypothetical protein
MSAPHDVLAQHPRPIAQPRTTHPSTMPRVKLLSNGKYHVMVTTAASGYSRWDDLASTRGSEGRAGSTTYEIECRAARPGRRREPKREPGAGTEKCSSA